MSLGLLRSRFALGVPKLSVNYVYASSRLVSYSRPGHQRYQTPTQGNPGTRDGVSAEDIRLNAEFEASKDIREYLRKWQETHSNELDPVRGPETANPIDASNPWAGNMLNDNLDTFDAGSDKLRAADEDRSEFADIGDEGGDARQFLEPGDLVSLFSPEGILSFGIYIRSIDKQQQFYTDRGKWRIAFPGDLDYVVKGFTSRESLAPLMPYFPGSAATLSQHMQSAIEGGVPRPAGAHILREIANFTSEVLHFYREHAKQLDNLHHYVADQVDKREFTLAELALEGLGLNEENLNEVSLFAVDWASRRHKFLIEKDQGSLFTDHYVAQPKRMASILETVTNWVHEHQGYHVRAAMGMPSSDLRSHPLQQFIQKAKKLIHISRKYRSPTVMGSVGPTSGCEGDECKVQANDTFSETDQVILEFLLHYSITPRQMTSATLRSTGSHIMRATGMYDTMEVNASTMPLFLQELGVVSPWENLRLLDQNLALPGHGVSIHADNAWDEVQKECERVETNLTDSMKDMRRDWGDLLVYCVDNPGAQEIDDGVSLERAGDDTYWVRVHVANPSAFLEHDGLIAKYAASRLQSLYVPERTYPMLPKGFTHKHFSLAAGRPSLTFSAKMNLQGDILDTEITNGTVHNVIYTTHDMLTEFFEPGLNLRSQPLQVGKKIQQPQDSPETLSDDDKNTFRTLRQLLLAFRDHRRRNGAIDFPYSDNTSLTVDHGSTLEPYKMQVKQSHFHLSDPSISLGVSTKDPHEVPDLTKRYLISTIMNLAGYVAGKWCADRSIPAVYDGTWFHPEYTQLTSENIAQSGGDAWRKLAAPRGFSSPTPIHHSPLGLDYYVKCTSPLRRYIDLLAHFQIEAALRHEHSTRTPLTTSTISSTLPFSHKDIESFISRSLWKSLALRDCSRASYQFWACLLLFRAFYFDDSPTSLPDTFPVLLEKPYSLTALLGTEFQDGFLGVISSLGVRCQVVVGEEFQAENRLHVGTLVDARITEVNMARQIVVMELVGVVKPFERVGEWA